MSLRWHCAEVYPNTELAVAQAIATEGFNAFLPMGRRLAKHARRVETVTYPLITNYVFVRFDAVIDEWPRLRSIRGMARILHQIGNPLRPSPIRDGEIEHLIDIAEKASAPPTPKDKITFPKLAKDTRASVIIGVLANTKGIVIRDDRGEVLLRVSGSTIRVPRETVRATS